MTLVAAFRCREGGILLCADREETEGDFKRPVDKIYHMSFPQCQVFIAGSGNASVISKACQAIHLGLWEGGKRDESLTEHVTLIEAALHSVYEKYVFTQQNYPVYQIGLLIVFAPRSRDCNPILYKTDDAMLVSEHYYAAKGAGDVIANYLADRLYKHGMSRSALAVLAAFIFRESENSTVGVGSGTEMQFIDDGEKSVQNVGWDDAEDLKSTIPALGEAIHEYWSKHPTAPEKLVKFLDAPRPSNSQKLGGQQ